MTRNTLEPPPVLDGARVIEYAVRDASVGYSGHSSLFVDGKEVGPVPRLAICQVVDTANILLFHCSSEWTVLGAVAYPSVKEAKLRAEQIYPGLSVYWIDAHVTEQQVADYLEKRSADQRCVLCGKGPAQIKQLITKNNLSVCDSCIVDLYEMLQD